MLKQIYFRPPDTNQISSDPWTEIKSSSIYYTEVKSISAIQTKIKSASMLTKTKRFAVPNLKAI